ncbi:Hypothetical predicted protein [Mytilus galloprovincialis]|uniref:Uncharacterized protein n=1 Tax=Mytilus galloprovincialis TaxID=29158 RepID=A0A8B6FW14_MYTGA|nr:Hypothetical predicted protein [Mytilus galloprovincialis]
MDIKYTPNVTTMLRISHRTVNSSRLVLSVMENVSMEMIDGRLTLDGKLFTIILSRRSLLATSLCRTRRGTRTETRVIRQITVLTDNLSDPDPLNFFRNLTQHVKDATHERGHILYSQILNGVPNVHRPNISDAQGNLVCDYFSVHATLACQKPKSMGKDISLRKCKEIDMTELKKDIVDSVSCTGIDRSVEQSVEHYQGNLSNIFDKHTPVTI